MRSLLNLRGVKSGKPLLTGLLVLLLLLCSLATASSCLHRFLHGHHQDHQTTTHYCLITLLQQGHTDLPVMVVTIQPPLADWALLEQAEPESFLVQIPALFPERGPPCAS